MEALDAGMGGRISFCETIAQLFRCDTCAHAWYDGTCDSWSACLWRAGPAGRCTMTMTECEDPVGSLPDWWTWTTCRPLVHDWMAAPFLAEVPLRSADDARGLIVLGRDSPFGNEDARQINAARRHLAAIEGIIVRLEAPVLVGKTQTSLTGREAQVLELLSEGLLARSIAQRLQVSERTVHKHSGISIESSMPTIASSLFGGLSRWACFPRPRSPRPLNLCDCPSRW